MYASFGCPSSTLMIHIWQPIGEQRTLNMIKACMAFNMLKDRKKMQLKILDVEC
jgi:hypothetical protein